MSKCVVLVGIKHSGKTSTGTILANAYNVPFFDIDHVIEMQTSKTCRELFSTEGFDSFQKAELEACKYIIEQQKEIIVDGTIKAIISTGGGICENQNALELLKSIGVFVYLDITEETAFDRILENSKKMGSIPATLGKIGETSLEEMKENFSAQYKERTVKYASLADICIKTSGLSQDGVCELFDLKWIENT